MSTTLATLWRSSSDSSGAPPTVRILPMSYRTALPFISSPAVPRAPAGVIVPAPVVVIQCIWADGPAWNTLPPDVAMNQP